MTYLYAFNVKINKQAYNKNLYKFCEYYKDIIFAITYEVKKKTYNIIVGINDTDFTKEIKLKASEIFEDLKCYKDYDIYYVSTSEIVELRDNIYTHRLSNNNPKMYLYFDQMIGRFKIEYISLFNFDVLYKFKKSDIDEIICWDMIFYDCLTNKDYERFNIWCVLRYWDEKHKFINIHQFNGMCDKDKIIPKDIKKYIDYDQYYDEGSNEIIDVGDDNYPYIEIEKIPNIFNITSFMRKLEKEAKEKDNYDDFIIEDYEKMIEEIKEKKALKTIRENKEMEIVDYDLDILFSLDEEKSDIKNIIFNIEEEEDDDEEYLEIVRTRRIKKSFMIN